MSLTISRGQNWRGRLVLAVPPGTPGRGDNGLKGYGYWFRGELTLGADAQTVADPEYGEVAIGGNQTAENLPISRPYDRSRDRQVYTELRPLRGRSGGYFYIWELDNYRQPTTSAPIETLEVVLNQIVLPEGSGSSDPSVIAGELQVNP